MTQFTQQEIDAMRARVRIESHPAARNPYRSAEILGEDGYTRWRVNQGWKLNPIGRTEIVWDRAQVGFPSGITEPEEIREMALALMTLAVIAEEWNDEYGNAIPEQMAKIAEEAASK